MKTKETVNLYRTLSVASVVVVTLGLTAVVCLDSHFYPDEWLCLLFLDILFLMIYIFQLEYERRRGRLFGNTESSFMRQTVAFGVCALLTYGMTWMPEFSRPVILIPILMCAVSNTTMAIVVGIFYDMLLGVSSGGNFHALLALCLLTLLGAVLSDALSVKEWRRHLSLLILFLNVMIPGIFYYMSYKEMDNQCFLFGIINGAVSGLFAYFLSDRIREGSAGETDNRLLDIVSEDYSEVKALRNFSTLEFNHAKKVSEIVFGCAAEIGCDPNVCLAAGFYYRLGRWQGEPYNENAVKKAKSLCFPPSVIRILSEYYGQERPLSSPESALVHMVDAIVKKAGIMNKDVGESTWNRDILIYQTLNEFSASGIYDQSGMSMNQFLKAREYLVKEAHL